MMWEVSPRIRVAMFFKPHPHQFWAPYIFTKPVSISSTHTHMPRAAHEVTLPKPLAGSPSAISYHEEGVGEELTRHNEIRPITRTK